MGEKKELTDEMRQQVNDFLERREAVENAKNEGERKIIIRGFKSEGRYELSDVKDYAIMGLQPKGTVISYMLAKKDIVFKVTKGTREQLDASLQHVESILAEYELDEGAKTYFERIRDALSRTIESRKSRETRKPETRGEENPENPTVEDPTEGKPENPTVENPTEGKPENPTVENPTEGKPGKPEGSPLGGGEVNIFAKRSELEFQVRSLNRHIEQCGNEIRTILARANVHGLLPEDAKTLSDNEKQLKFLKEELKKAEEELKRVKEETDKKLDKYDENKRIIDTGDIKLVPEDMRNAAIIKALEENIKRRETMLLGDRTFGADYLAELDAWKRKLAGYRNGNQDQVDTKSSDGRRDFMEYIEEEAKKSIIEKLKKENEGIEEEVKGAKIDINFLLERRKKEREEEQQRKSKPQEKPQGRKAEEKPQGKGNQEKPQGESNQEKPQGESNQGKPQGEGDQGKPQGEGDQEKPQGEGNQEKTQGKRAKYRNARDLILKINNLEKSKKKLEDHIKAIESAGTSEGKNIEKLRESLETLEKTLAGKKRELEALGLSPEEIAKIEKSMAEAAERTSNGEESQQSQGEQTKPRKAQDEQSKPIEDQGEQPKGQGTRKPEPEVRSTGSNRQILEKPITSLGNGDKLEYFSLGILDRFRAKRRAYEIANGHKPGLLRTATLVLPSMKYSRLAEKYIMDNTMSIDEIIYSKYRREMQMFDQALANEQSEELVATPEPVEAPKPERRENSRAARRMSDAFYRVDDETRKRINNVARNASTRNTPSENEGHGRETTDDSEEKV